MHIQQFIQLSSIYDIHSVCCIITKGLKIFMIIHLHNLHFYNVYMYHSEDNIILITRGISFCRRDKHDQYTLYNQYYYLLLSGKLSFCTLSRNQFTPNLCIIEVTSIELYAKFSQTTPFLILIFCNKLVQPINLSLSIELFHSTCERELLYTYDNWSRQASKNVSKY